MPTALQRSSLYGVELDSISGRIAKQLYQKANMESQRVPKNSFDPNTFYCIY